MKYKAVFLDIDGTLIHSDHSVSPLTRQTLETLLNKGMHTILVSARPYHGITTIAQAAGTEEQIICSLNGSYIVNKGKAIFDTNIQIDTVQELETAIGKENITAIYYCGMQWYSNKNNAHTAKEQKITKVPCQILSFEEMLDQWSSQKKGPNKILYVADSPEQIEALRIHIPIDLKQKLTISSSKPVYLEIMNRDASKMEAIKYILRYFNINREDSIAIGDHFNDAKMIQYAGLGIAMGNAPQAIKNIADFITDTNNNDGVAKALHKFCLNGNQ